MALLAQFAPPQDTDNFDLPRAVEQNLVWCGEYPIGVPNAYGERHDTEGLTSKSAVAESHPLH
jgi:hypothetical protein